MVSTSLLACIVGFLLCLVASSPAVPDGHYGSRARSEGSGLSGQDSPSPPPPPSGMLLGTRSNLSLLADAPLADNQWWVEMENKATRCLGCNKGSAKRDFKCEDRCPRDVNMEDFRHAIEAASLLNEVGETSGGHSMQYVRYNSVVVYICNCKGNQDFPRDQLEHFRNDIFQQCRGSNEDSVRSGHVWYKQWGKGYQVDSWEGFQKIMEDPDKTGCGKKCTGGEKKDPC
ncbi:hypothetical protein PG985_004514 [Apiospora marii]|uniref:Uncharacterized protein n=1 Tax=Apiospora marii TaxID=335849 RepID=A0ABR1S9L2_9PEZI